MLIGGAGCCAFSSSARMSFWLRVREGSFAAPNPSAPTTSIVVFALTSSFVVPPRRATSAFASFRPSELSLPVKTTTCPCNGLTADSTLSAGWGNDCSGAGTRPPLVPTNGGNGIKMKENETIVNDECTRRRRRWHVDAARRIRHHLIPSDCARHSYVSHARLLESAGDDLDVSQRRDPQQFVDQRRMLRRRGTRRRRLRRPHKRPVARRRERRGSDIRSGARDAPERSSGAGVLAAGTNGLRAARPSGGKRGF